MNNQQLDAVLEYLNDESGTVTLEATYEALNEGKITDALAKFFDKRHKAYAKKATDFKKNFLGLFKSNKKTVDINEFMNNFELTKVEGQNDLYTMGKYSIGGKTPYVKLADGLTMSHLAEYPETFKMFIDEAKKFVDDKKYRDAMIAVRIKCDIVEVDEFCKNIKLEDVVFTKGWNAQGYSYYLCQYIISLKCSKMKALKYHTYGFRLDTNLGWSDRWFDYPPSFLDKYN